MDFEEYLEQHVLYTVEPERINNLTAKKVLNEYIKKSGKLPKNLNEFIEDLLFTYFEIEDANDKKLFDDILNSYNSNYQFTIANAIYYLLGKKKELKPLNINPLLWPGVIDIQKENNKYIVETILGNIEVYKANKIFSNTDSSHIFKRELMGQCYNRTYEFLKQNRDYNAVLSYEPNFFYGGHYHAYLEKNSQVLDIAANAYYKTKEFSDKILCGKVIKKLSYEETEEKFKELQYETPEFENYNKLHVLALYYERKNAYK